MFSDLAAEIIYAIGCNTTTADQKSLRAVSRQFRIIVGPVFCANASLFLKFEFDSDSAVSAASVQSRLIRDTVFFAAAFLFSNADHSAPTIHRVLEKAIIAVHVMVVLGVLGKRRRRRSHPFSGDPANNFLSILADFGDLSEKLFDRIICELNEIVQYQLRSNQAQASAAAGAEAEFMPRPHSASARVIV
ncbi:hypothetical protein B0H16DRAFT_1467966 [Mycena metata]|uniref:Uncharacterized protein n=1 Tax=Mycena metata TaxID=1033252 RepID=A0AAD7I3F9_9AGAR|nr:hypothetical protein B0H16DRAFT_1467966 [Mycena metata]